MSTTISTEDRAHPIAGFASGVHRVLDGLSGAPAWSMTPEEQRSVLVDLARAQARIAGLRLRVLAAADRTDIAADSAATSTGAWLAHATRRTRGAAHADVQLALALDTGFTATREALAAGAIDLEQAAVIVRAVQALHDTGTVVDRVRAEEHLVAAAGEFDHQTLKMLGRRVFEVIDPEAADLAEGRRLEAEETAAARATFLQLSANPDGTHTGRFKIPALHAAMLTKMLHAFTHPHQSPHPDPENGTDGAAQAELSKDRGVGPVEAGRRSRPERLGEAFCRLLERIPPDRLPRTGGMSATVVVLLDYDQLLTGLGTTTLDTGQPLSAATARLMACEAGIIPAVWRRALGSPSVVLDLGRRTRLHTEPQRTALTIRDRGCTTVGCDRPAAWCHAHHDQPWSRGGPTSVANGRLLCAFHHHKAHSPTYDTTQLPTGQIQFHRRT